MVRFGMCFSRDFIGDNPLSHIGVKKPVYLRLFELCGDQGWEVYALTRKTYKGGDIFNGAWLFNTGKFERVEHKIKIDIVFDWVGTLDFPPKNQPSLKVVNCREFKDLTCNKWEAYQLLKDYSPLTLWVGEFKNLNKQLSKIKTQNIVLKPFNGLRGKGIYIGPPKGLANFVPDNRAQYILQEFVDTSNGISGLTPGKHDLRVVIINNEVVWSHIRVPALGTYLANAAQGGNLTEIDYTYVPESVKDIVKVVSKDFYNKYDNPVFSLDFGIGPDGIPKIFEINDQIGFPKWEMKNRDNFLNALVKNFSSKL